jgi:threonine dehydratase
VHPFDDPYVMAGQGTVGLEICEDAPAAEVVVVPVGGGGLASGVTAAVKGRRPAARVVTVEPEGSAVLARSLAAGEPVRLDGSRSIADGLVCPIIGERCFAVARELVDAAVTVTEDEIEVGFRFLYERAKLAAEPAGAAAVAALLAGKVDVAGVAGVAAVVSGGNVAPETASGILAGR